MADHTLTSFHISGLDQATLQTWATLDFESFMQLFHESPQILEVSMSSRWGCFERFLRTFLPESHAALMHFMFTPMNTFHKALIAPGDIPPLIDLLETLIHKCKDQPAAVRDFFSHQGFSVEAISEQIQRGINYEEQYDCDEGDDVESIFSYIQQIVRLMHHALSNLQIVVFLRWN